MRYALSFSGGKDSTLALDRAYRQGLKVDCLFTIHEGSSGRVRFHGTRAELIAAQARAIRLPVLQDFTHPDNYEVVFTRVLARLKDDGIGGIIFGNIHLADIRQWYEERVRARGLVHVEPLWHATGTDLLAEFVGRGYRTRIVSVDRSQAPERWLGREIDETFIAEVQQHPEIDPCGERGEYHTFVWDGPLFAHRLDILSGERVEMEGHILLDLIPGGES